MAQGQRRGIENRRGRSGGWEGSGILGKRGTKCVGLSTKVTNQKKKKMREK